MTARGVRTGEDAEDLDVEEVLALVKEGNVPAPGDGHDDSRTPGHGHGDGPGTAPGCGAGDAPGPAHVRDTAPAGYDDLLWDSRDATATATASAPGAAHPEGEHSGRGGAAAGHGGPHSAAARHRATPWPAAREIAARAARASVPRGAAAGDTPAGARRTTVSVPLDAALGLVLAAPLAALTDLPSFDTSAMDGWAVAGPGPWDVRDEGVLAGHARPEPLTDGEAVRIATGARVPQGSTAVLRSEHGRMDDKGRLHSTREVVHGQDIRPRGQECGSGDQLLPLGTLVTPAVLGLAAAAGYDTLTVIPRPRAEVFVLGDELLAEGLPHDGLIRDALGPMLPPWLRALGAEVTAVRRIGDDAGALHKAVTGSGADLIVTTGGTAAGPVDHVHPVLRRIDAEFLVDGVQVRPGHPMLLARTKEHQHLVGLPGNPLAAVSGLLTLAEPLLRTLAARPAPEPYTLPLSDAVHGHPYDTRLVPVVLRGDHAVPLHYNGPAMLRGVAAADALAVVPPGGAGAGQEAELLDLPWAAAGIGVCFT